VSGARLPARWRGVCAGLVFLAILGGCSSRPPQTISPRVVAEPPAPPSTTVSIHLVNNKILVPVVLNGNVLATFLLDTGANTTVITPTLAARLGINLSGAAKQRVRIASGQEVEVSFIRLKSIGIGAARIADFGVVVYDLPTLVPEVTAPVSAEGLLGTDFVARFTMTLAPRARTLTLQRDDGPVR